MKTPLIVATLALCLTSPLWAQSDSDSTPPPGEHHWHGGGPGGLTEDEKTELKSAHDAAIAANPDLATQEKQLQQEWQDYMKKMHDAMVKADPKVEPILEKMHHHHGPPPGGGDAGNQ